MGLKSDWRKILNDLFPECFLHSMPQGVEVPYVVDDYFINFFRIFNGTESWEEVKRRVLKRTVAYDALSNHINMYVVLFDEKRFVPTAKAPTQLKRTEDSPSLPLTSEEAAAFESGKTPLVSPTGQKPGSFLNRAWLTSAVRPKIISFICNSFADLAYPDKEHGRRLMLDGAKIDLLCGNSQLCRNMNNIKSDIETQRYLDPLVAYECEVFIPTNAVYKRGIQSGDGTGLKTCTMYDSNTIGEADLKIVYHISKLLPHGNVLISSCDSDMIAILLLNMKDWIDSRTGKIPHSIYLDNTGPGSNKACYVDVVMLWRRLIVHFEKYFPNVVNPIETFVLLMIMTGSDFVKEFKQLSVNRIWKGFVEGGNEIFFPSSRKTTTVFNSEMKEMKTIMEDLNISEFGSFLNETLPTNTLLLCSKVYGDPSVYHTVKIMESKIFDFVLFVYRIVLKLNDTIKLDGLTQYEYIRNVTDKVDMTKSTDGQKFQMKSLDEMRAEIRRMSWNLDYWINGGKSGRRFQHPSTPYFGDCLAQTQYGVSIWGWQKDTNGVIVRAKNVAFA